MQSTHIGGLIASSPAAWVSLGRHIVVPFGRILRVFDCSGATPVAISALRGHSGAVVCVVPAGAMRVASASKDGTVRIWDVDDGSCLRTFDLGQKLSYLCNVGKESLACVGSRSVVLLSLARQERDARSGKVSRQKVRTALFSNMKIKFPLPKVAASADGEILAVIDGFRLTYATLSRKQASAVSIKFPAPLTTVAVSKDAQKLAVGDANGRIYIIASPNDHLPKKDIKVTFKLSDVTPSVLHWHSSAVRALVFSEDANLLLSGGSEAVLVSWKMTRAHLGSPSFLPRLSAPILGISISPDQATYSVTHADNSVRIIDHGSGAVAATIRGISAAILGFDTFDPLCDLSSTVSTDLTGKLSVTPDPGINGGLIVAGNGRDAQVFDVYKGEHIRDIPILRRNVIFEPKKQHLTMEHPQPAQVSVVRIHPSSRYMASVDFQDLTTGSSEDYGTERFISTLRIWERGQSAKPFALTAVEAHPHGFEAPVSSICFHPSLPILATSSAKGTFKLWRATVSTTGVHAKSWRCELEMGHKGLPCNSICFSSDGSLLAVANGSVLTLWHVEDIHEAGREHDKLHVRPDELCPVTLRVNLLHTLVHPPSEEPVRSLAFSSSQMPLLIAATDTGVYVWHALTQGIWWSSRIRNDARLMAVDMHTDRFALAVKIPPLAIEMEGGQGGTFAQNANKSRGAASADASPSKRDNRAMDVDLVAKDSQEADISSGKNTPVRRKPKNKAQRQIECTPNRKSKKPIEASTDSAIAIFHAASPIPTIVSRLPAGVSAVALSFVPARGSLKGTPSPLVCIDSNLELSFYGTEENKDSLSFLTGEGLERSNDETRNTVGKLDTLLGESWQRKQYSMSSSPMEGEAENSFTERRDARNSSQADGVADVCKAFSTIFNGPVHIQAPVSSLSLDFVNTLLPAVDSLADTVKEDVIAAAHESIGKTKEGLSLDLHSSSAPQGMRPHDDPSFEKEYNSCREFCSKVVKSYLKTQ